MPQLSQKYITRIFFRLDAKFGELWTDYVGNDELELKHRWSKALSGLTEIDIKRGLDASYTHKTPPDQDQFIRLCRPSVNAFKETTTLRDCPKSDPEYRLKFVESMNNSLK